jgi:hypothetical protein
VSATDSQKSIPGSSTPRSSVYHATDDDLPEIFWPGGKAPEPKPVDVNLRAEVAAALHYPAILVKKAEREQERRSRESVLAVARELRQREQQERRIYVKAAKKIQLWDWLRSLAPFVSRMKPHEAQFCRSLLEKFETYGDGTKWITLRQFEWCRSLASRYLLLPREARAA